jgi:hypothetical protein
MMFDSLSPTQLGDRVLAAKSGQHDPDLLLRRVLLARLAADLADMLFSC